MAAPTGILFNDPYNKPLSAAGQFMAGCTRVFYLSQTTTLAPVYQDGFLQFPYSQTPTPITADSAGRFSPIYLDPTIAYRCQLFTAGGILLEDADPYVSLGSLQQGTFTMTGVGFSGAAPTGVAEYIVQFGRVCTLFVPPMSGTSNSTSFAFTGLPVVIQSTIATQNFAFYATDNAVQSWQQAAIFSANNSLVFIKNGSTTGWTASGTKAGGAFPITYLLN